MRRQGEIFGVRIHPLGEPTMCQSRGAFAGKAAEQLPLILPSLGSIQSSELRDNRAKLLPWAPRENLRACQQ